MATKRKRKVTKIVEEEITPNKKRKKATKKKKAKKKVKKRSSRAKKKRSSPGSKRNVALEKALMENTLILQKVTTNLALKFDSLSKKISELLELFETSAKSLAEKGFETEEEGEDISGIKQDMGKLMEQNKIIARSLSILHETQEKNKESPPPEKQMIPSKSPYDKSISQKPRSQNMSGI